MFRMYAVLLSDTRVCTLDLCIVCMYVKAVVSDV